MKLTFNSEVEENFSIKVFDRNNRQIKSHSPYISDDGKVISIQLPTLMDGIYKIEYYIISSNDGHPIQGNYQIQVGTNNEPLENLKDANSLISQNSSNTILIEFIIYILKAFYYFGFILLIGWLIWWQTIQSYSGELKRKYILWGILFQMIHLVGLISVILIQVDIFTSNGLFFTPNFPFDTNFGYFWLISLITSLVGFLSLFRNRWVDIAWITILVFCKSLNGHARSIDLTYIVATLNSFHLLAAAVWAAGLTFIVIFWHKQKLYVKDFLPTFSKYALISFILLGLTGMSITFMYSPNLALFVSDWGRLLIIKIVIVTIVILMALKMRNKITYNHNTIGKWIKIDFTVMIIIIIIVSILTYLSPIP